MDELDENVIFVLRADTFRPRLFSLQLSWCRGNAAQFPISAFSAAWRRRLKKRVSEKERQHSNLYEHVLRICVS